MAYELRYLPLFYRDFERAVRYIAFKLHNPEAAENLAAAIEQAIQRRLPVAEAFEKYQSRKHRSSPYYRIFVLNYMIFYVVLEGESGNKIMEVRRLLHQRQNWKEILHVS